MIGASANESTPPCTNGTSVRSNAHSNVEHGGKMIYNGARRTTSGRPWSPPLIVNDVFQPEDWRYSWSGYLLMRVLRS